MYRSASLYPRDTMPLPTTAEAVAVAVVCPWAVRCCLLGGAATPLRCAMRCGALSGGAGSWGMVGPDPDVQTSVPYKWHGAKGQGCRRQARAQQTQGPRPSRAPHTQHTAHVHTHELSAPPVPLRQFTPAIATCE